MDKSYFLFFFSFIEIEKGFLFIPVRKIGNKIMKTDKYFIIKMYVDKTIQK